MRGVEAGEKMKFNLKNRPPKDASYWNSTADCDRVNEWFEGFEKELRELDVDKWHRDHANLPNFPLSNFIREILGE